MLQLCQFSKPGWNDQGKKKAGKLTQGYVQETLGVAVIYLYFVLDRFADLWWGEGARRERRNLPISQVQPAQP